MDWGDKIIDKVLRMVLYHQVHRNGIEKNKCFTLRAS